MSEAALRADIPPHFAKSSPCWPIFNELRGIHAKLEEIKAKNTHSIEDLAHYRQMLNAIDCRRQSGVFAGHIDHDDPSKTVIPEGQAVCSDELAASYALLESLTDTAAPMSAPMLAIQRQLESIKARLTDALTRGVQLSAIAREQEELDAIDAARMAHGGVFCGDLASGRIPAGQAVLSDTLAHCYRLVQGIQRRTEE